uniref:Uncharacterized protein n=1 Tax=Anguilla anguilla TaxID=7936 RepID=A0A0E9VFA2_ANGAN
MGQMPPLYTATSGRVH